MPDEKVMSFKANLSDPSNTKKTSNPCSVEEARKSGSEMYLQAAACFPINSIVWSNENFERKVFEFAATHRTFSSRRSGQEEEDKKNKHYARQDALVARKINDQCKKNAYLAQMLQNEENANMQMYLTTNTDPHDLVIAPVRGSTMRQQLVNHCSKFANYEMKPPKNIWRCKSMDNDTRKITDESVRSKKRPV